MTGGRATSAIAATVVVAALLVLQAAVLALMGRPLVCTCGTILAWYPSASGPGTSQHVADWYSFSHVLHGLLFYLLLRAAMPGAPPLVRLAIAMGMEVGWEVLENTPLIIERYRQTAMAQGYFGDSIVNSLADSLAAAAGFLVARSVPVWVSVAIFAAVEVLLATIIRDNLTLNVIQLIAPDAGLSEWQGGGG